MSCVTTFTNIGDYAKFTQSKPFNFVTKLTGWFEEISGIGTLKREFRWSTNNLVRASWMDLTNDNLQRVILDPNNTLYVDFRYTLTGGGPITVEDIGVEYELAPESADKFWGYHPPMLVSDKGNVSNLTKIENFTFRPYDVNPAVVLYKELALTVNKMFGHDVEYARAVPMAVGRDYTLHEWTLYDVNDPCCLKVVVPQNEFPDSKINYNPFGLDFENPFEVHIVKEYFEQVFGYGTAPQKRDILYFPLTNRIYEIESSYLWKDIMQKEVYWKVSLKKYQPKSNRYETQDLREKIEVITYNSEERFGKDVEEDTIKDTKPLQYDTKLGSRDYDSVRLAVNDNLIISETQFTNYSILLSQSQYDLRSIFDPLENPTGVEYRSLATFPANDEETNLEAECVDPINPVKVTIAKPTERSLCGWFQEIKPKTAVLKDQIKGQISKGTVGSDTTSLHFLIAARRNYKEGDLLKITRFNGLSLYGSFVSSTPVSGGYSITIVVKNEIISFLDTYYPNWASSSVTSGYSAEITYEVVLMDGYDGSNGWKFSLFGSRFFLFKSTTEEKVFILPNNIVEGSWYAFFLNISNFYQQLTLDVWVRKWNETESNPQRTTDLENIYSKAIFIEPIDRSASTGYTYRLPASNMIYTNIRLFTKIETDWEKQITILNETIVQDAQYAIIIDNALPRLNLPWIGRTA